MVAADRVSISVPLGAAFSFSGFLTPHPADTVAARIDGGGHAGSMLMGLQQVERIGRHLRVAAISGLRPKKTRFRRRSIDNRELYRCTVGCINIYEPFLPLSFFFLFPLPFTELLSFSFSAAKHTGENGVSRGERVASRDTKFSTDNRDWEEFADER